MQSTVCCLNKEHSLSPDAIVIPIKLSAFCNKACLFAVHGPSSLSRVETRLAFPMELAFVMMTVHKAQGRTTPRVALLFPSTTLPVSVSLHGRWCRPMMLATLPTSCILSFGARPLSRGENSICTVGTQILQRVSIAEAVSTTCI
jgi:hypothetical protein